MIVISICVISHEGGHYLAARWRGVLVHEFSFGMGPVVFSRRRGDTLWSVRAFPIGGFVSLEGEDGGQRKDNVPDLAGVEAEQTEPDRSLQNKRPWERLLILAAGACVNLLLAWLLTAALLVGAGTLDLSRPAIGVILPDTPAQAADLRPGDLIKSINGTPLNVWSDIRKTIQDENAASDTFVLEIERESKIMEITIDIPRGAAGGGRMLGVQPMVVKYPLHKALAYGLGYSWEMGMDIIRGLWQALSGQLKSEVVGPVGIAVMAGDALKSGAWSFLAFLGIINLHLGLINLFPFPALDGGRIIFVMVEMFTRRKVPEKWESYVHLAGFVILITLIILVTGKDIIRLFS